MSQFSRDILPVRSLVSGDVLSLPLFRFKGTGRGPAVYLQASVHGAEVQGNATIFLLLKYFSSVKLLGDVTLVPLANPHGINQKTGEYTMGRFDPSTGTNWNRAYWKATCEEESKRRDADQINVEEFVKQFRGKAGWGQVKGEFKKALKTAIKNRNERKRKEGGMEAPQQLGLILQDLSCQADIVLDLHTGPASARYLYLPEYALQSALHFKIPHLLIIPVAFDGAMDEASFCSWWELHKALEKEGVNFPMEYEAYTVEEGGQERLVFAEALEDAQNIVSYLKFKGVLGTEAPDLMALEERTIWACGLNDYQGLYAPQGGLVDFLARPGEMVKKGEVFCQLLNFKNPGGDQDPAKCLTALRAYEDSLVINHSPSAAVHEGTELYRFFTKFWKVE